MIASGNKKEEYREIKPYWIKRLGYYYESGENGYWDESLIKLPDIIRFKNGYSKNAPTMDIECLDYRIGQAKPEWSDNWQGDVFILELGKIISS